MSDSDTDDTSMEIEENKFEGNSIDIGTKKKIGKNEGPLTLTSSGIDLVNGPTSTELVATAIAIANATIDIDDTFDIMTEKNCHVSRQKSATSVKSEESPNLEYFHESDYSLNIADAVANILAADVGDVRGDKESRQEMAIPGTSTATAMSLSEHKRTKPLQQKKSKNPIRGSKSMTATEKHFGDLKPKKSIINAAMSKKSVPKLKASSRVDDFYPKIEPSSQAIAQTGQSGAAVRPIPPTLLSRNPNMLEVNLYLAKVQEYINRLGYHHKGEPKIHIRTHMSLKHQTDTARQLIKAGEPIKCLHALVLGIHFTNCTSLIERFTLNFRSYMNGKEYKHVVLGIYMFGFFGAIGISRDIGLQDKPVAFPRLSDLVSEFKRSYEESGHVLTEVRIGSIVSHDPYSLQHINWSLGTLGSKSRPVEDTSEADKIAKYLRLEMGPACLKQQRIEISPPLSIPGSQTAMSSIFISDLNVKNIASVGPPRMIGSTTSRKAPSRTRASTNNMAVKKKSKN